MNISTIGIDLAKNIFQLHGVSDHGIPSLTKRLKRDKLLPFLANTPPCLIGIEACGGSNYWARQIKALGHDVKLISPQYVKPFVITNKNDYNDAAAICMAVQQPEMRFVAIKDITHQDIQTLHRIRTRLISGRTALVNQTRGILLEFGILIPIGIRAFRREVPLILEDAENELTITAREIIADQYHDLLNLDEKIIRYEKRIQQVFKNTPICQRMAQIEGVGPLIATALLAAVGDAHNFKNGRQMATWLGLVPRQHSSGNKNRLLGISKRGDPYLRTLLIHGARSIVFRCNTKNEARNRWIKNLRQRRGINRTSVALANKNARILWALMVNDDAYRYAA
ncbi:MAG: IS110 family transposase [Sedimenticola sp.]|nr:IS110 family transposase [Sedimenticola sp.]